MTEGNVAESARSRRRKKEKNYLAGGTTGDVSLQAPRASYGYRRSRVARRGNRKFNRSLLRRRDPGRFAAREQPPLFGSPFRPARFGRLSACGRRALQTLCQPPRQRGHAQIPTGGADAVRAPKLFQEVPAVSRPSRRRFDSPPTAGGGADHWSSVGTGARWRHRGAIQDALGGTLRTSLEAGNGPPPLSLRHRALLSRSPGPAPPNQPPLPPNADRGGKARALPQHRGTFPSAGLRLCSPRRLAPSLPRHRTS